MERLILKKRDAYSIELKVRYLLSGGKDQKARRRRYSLDMFFFFPQSFNVNESTYERRRFFEETKHYVRFNTPVLGVRRLIDREHPSSPLFALYRQINGSRRPGTIVHHAKMYAAIYKSTLRDTNRRLEGDANISKPAKVVKRLGRPARAFHKFAAEAREALSAEQDRAVLEQIDLIDEHVSLLVEHYLSELLSDLRAGKRRARRHQESSDTPLDATSADLEGTIARVMRSEWRYRRKRGFATVSAGSMTERHAEEYAYRQKTLKRFASEVLFMGVKRTDEAKRIEHVLYAAAAGISMVFATGIAFYGQSVFGSVTTALFILLVISYMLKDRMKDVFRDIFRRTLGTRFFDRKERLYDQSRRLRLAVVKERAVFVSRERLDPLVFGMRNSASIDRSILPGMHEEVLAYNRQVTLKVSAASRIHARSASIADITIFDLQSFLRSLATQYTTVPLFNSRNDVALRRAHRTYHLNVVLHYSDGEVSSLHRVRLVVDHNGIRRVEHAGNAVVNDGAVTAVTAGTKDPELVIQP